MTRRTFDGRTIAKVLQRHGFEPAGRTGSHVKLRWESPDTDEVRVVTVPMKSEDEIPRATVRSIAEQCGARDFDAWCEWISENA